MPKLFPTAAWAALAMALAAVAASVSPAAAEGGQIAERPAALAEVAAWDAMIDQIKEAGHAFLRDAPAPEAARAEGLRYLARQLGAAIDKKMALGEPHPVLRLVISDIRKTGMDAAEAKYVSVPVEGHAVYRLWGKLGTARHIAIQLYGLPLAGAAANRDGLGAAADGSFELMIAGERPAGWTGPWLRLAPTDNELFVREYFDDWDSETMSSWFIERVDAGALPGPFDTERAGVLAAGIGREFASRLPIWLKEAARVRGDGSSQIGQPHSSAMGLGDNAYGNGWFALGDDEALIVEFDAPDARLWSYELGNYWWESFDFVNHTSSLTGHQAVPSPDGRYRLVISVQDPGAPNWLDTAGHHEGAIMYRYVLGRTQPVPAMRKVALKDVFANLPKGTPRVSVEARAAQIAARRRHVAERWAP